RYGDIVVSSCLPVTGRPPAHAALYPLPSTATVTANALSLRDALPIFGTAWQDAVGNTGVGGNDSVAIDRVNPTVTVNIVDTQLRDTDSRCQNTINFSKASSNFSEADISVSAGLTLTAGSLAQDAVNPL